MKLKFEKQKHPFVLMSALEFQNGVDECIITEDMSNKKQTLKKTNKMHSETAKHSTRCDQSPKCYKVM